MEDVIKEYDSNLNNGLIKTFNRMFLGLLLTAIIAYYTYSTGAFLRMPYAVLAIVELAVVLIFSLMFRKLSPVAVSLLFYIYAAINGLTMSTIFAIYSITNISSTFLITSLLFGALALYGSTTKKDLSKFSTLFCVTLVVGLIVSIINLFIGNSFVNIAIDWIMLFLFMGITAYDMQKLKNMQNFLEYDTEKIYIYCAMELYLDFINIFIRLLSLTGNRRR